MVPDVSIGQAQDFMPKLDITSQGGGAGVTRTRWQALPTARAYFLSAMSGSDQGGQTECAIPEGIFAKTEGAMLRGIAYGQELNLAHPPRLTDKKIPWEPSHPWPARRGQGAQGLVWRVNIELQLAGTTLSLTPNAASNFSIVS